MDIAKILLYLMASFYIFTGISHFRIPKFFLAITPKWVPYPEVVNIVVGVIAVFPANVYHHQKARKKGKGVVGTLLRLPIQLLLIYWAYQYT
ncbi:MAG: DoxX family protein [Bacteroidota bacterium]